MRLMPRSLVGRLILILVAGVLAAQFTSLWLHMDERALLIRQGLPTIGGLPDRFWIHLSLMLGMVMVVGVIAVRIVTRPLKQLADAADAFGKDLDSAPLAEAGPTETRRAAEAFNRMQRRLRRLIAERSRALAAVSHDLRTPLTRMRLRAELVDDEALRNQINADIDDMQAMVESTLDYLRGLSENEAEQEIDVDALLQSVAADEQAMQRPVTLVSSKAAPFRGRLSALKRAIANLIDNAVKYGHEARVSLIDDPDSLQIVVVDRGPGIPEADLMRVLEPYVRLEVSRSRETGGVGLGLAVASDAARLHGGYLRLTNLHDGGLRAAIWLPRHPGESGERMKSAAPASAD